MSELWPRPPKTAWTGIPPLWLPWNMRYLIALQKAIDDHERGEGPRCTVPGCGARVSWNNAGTQLHHIEVVEWVHQPRLDTEPEDKHRQETPKHYGVAWSARHRLPGEQ